MNMSEPPTWYLCERRDDVAHHNSWICYQMKDLGQTRKNVETASMLVAVPWYIPRAAHTMVIRQQLSRTGVTIMP